MTRHPSVLLDALVKARRSPVRWPSRLPRAYVTAIDWSKGIGRSPSQVIRNTATLMSITADEILVLDTVMAIHLNGELRR